jgi:NTP pyrophosphatase (non-canonical NTP hydrolase)
MTPRPPSFADLTADIRAFSQERDWTQFHDPKSLILALVGEVGELAELFQWVPAHEAGAAYRAGDRQRRAAEEMSDVLIYLLRLADVLGVDLAAAAAAKLAQGRERFPAADFDGIAPVKE